MKLFQMLKQKMHQEILVQAKTVTKLDLNYF